MSLERNDPPKSPPLAVPSVAAGWVCMLFIGGWCMVGFGVAALLHPRLFPREPASQSYWGFGVFAGIVCAAVHAYWLGLFGAFF